MQYCVPNSGWRDSSRKRRGISSFDVHQDYLWEMPGGGKHEPQLTVRWPPKSRGVFTTPPGLLLHRRELVELVGCSWLGGIPSITPSHYSPTHVGSRWRRRGSGSWEEGNE